MLVLSRKPGESIVFAGLGISLSISELRHSSVTVGITAPRDVRILRGELATDVDLQHRKTTLSSRFGHELRNHLNAISLALQALDFQATENMPFDRELLGQALAELDKIERWAMGDVIPDADSLSPENRSGNEGSSNGRSAYQEASGQPGANGQPEASGQPETLEPPCWLANGLDPETNKRDIGKNRTTLLVEDNENEAMLLSALLQHYGFRVITAMDGQAAMDVMNRQEWQPDIVLLDMNMPGMGGMDFVKSLRHDSRWRHLPVIAVTGMPLDEQPCSLEEMKVNSWFQKPVKPDHLVREICDSLSVA